MIANGPGYYETGFESEDFVMEEPSPVPEEIKAALVEITSPVNDNGPDVTPGMILWDRYFNKSNRPSIASVLRMREVLSPKRKGYYVGV